MMCHVCSRPPSDRLQFLCATCARNQLYPLRIDQVNALLQKDASGREIDNAVGKNQGDEAESQSEPNRWSIQAANTRSAQSAARTQLIRERIAALRKEIAEGKKDVARRRSALAQRRSDAESVNFRVSDRRAAAVSEVQHEIQKTEQKWTGSHSKFIESRVFLCREAANLYGLRQKTRRRKGEVISTYVIGGISIVNLRDLNSKSCQRRSLPAGANQLRQMPIRRTSLHLSVISLTFSSKFQTTFLCDYLLKLPCLTVDIPRRRSSHRQHLICRLTISSPGCLLHTPQLQAQSHLGRGM